MSFFDDASLVFLPSGEAGKDGKAYSMKPTDGSGDFTFSRGSNLTATRVDSNGLIEKGRENLFLNSDTPATQSITITNGGVYVLSFLGTGSVVASGGASFTLNGTGEFDRVQNYFVSSSTSVTLTISGTITEPQLELGLAATEYIKSGATTGLGGILEDSPRFDYSGGASCPSLLLEPSRTNLLSNSEYLQGNSEFQILSSSVTFADYTETSPDGNGNALRVLEAEGSGSHNWYYSNISGVSDGTTYCISFFAKSIRGRNIAINEGGVGINVQGTIDLSDGSVLTDVHNNISTESYGNGWYRISAVGTMNGTTQRIIFYSVDGTTTSFEGDTTSGVSLWGVQIEEGSYPTSYIPNHSGGSVTRNGDVCEGAGTSSTFNDSEGVLYAEIAAIADDLTFRSISLSDGTNNNRVIIRYRTTSNVINFLIAAGGSVIRNIQHSVTDITDYHKLAIKYKDRDIGIFVDGAKVATYNDTFTLSSLSEVSFTDGSGSDVFYGKADQVIVFNTALSDANCITLTS